MSPSDSLGAQVEPGEGGGWRIVVPVRGEEVAVEKRTVVYEEVDIRREMIEETQPLSEHIRPT